MEFKTMNKLGGWVVFLIAAFVYIATMEDTVSLWDCGEYIATSYKLEVGHPPGAPTFMMLGRIFSFGVGEENVAYMINLMSALCSAFTILFLFWTVTYFAKGLLLKDGEKVEGANAISILSSGLIGSLAYTFSDSFWFSAVEAEVYAMSSMFTAATFWAILKWDEEMVLVQKGLEPPAHPHRWIILIMFLVGLSIGVHLLNLLCLPAIALIMYFRYSKMQHAGERQFSTKGIVLSILMGTIVLVFIQNFIIPKTIDVIGDAEVALVNSLGFPFFAGGLFVLLLVFAYIFMAIRGSRQEGISKNLRISLVLMGITLGFIITGKFFVGLFIGLALGVLAFFSLKNALKTDDALAKFKNVHRLMGMGMAVVLIGYSSFAMIVIRSNSNPPVDENNPEGFAELGSYLRREQYGDWPLLKGQSFNSEVDYEATRESKGSDVYRRLFTVVKGGEDKAGFETQEAAEEYIAQYGGDEVVEKYYKIQDGKGRDRKYKDESLFPRMWKEDKASEYAKWGYDPNRKGDMRPTIWGNDRTMLPLPTFTENVNYMVEYQFNWMYWRYFMWNFSGRQNDEQGHGSGLDGNWLTGVGFLDQQRVGDTSKMPAPLANNPSFNKFFMLPLLLGLIGLLLQFVKRPDQWGVLMLLFLFTGLFIVVYLNQYPRQPRERDYAYAASFYAFAIWIGLGVTALYKAYRDIEFAQFKQLGIFTGFTFVLFMILAYFSEGGVGVVLTHGLYIALIGLALIALFIFLKSKTSATVATYLALALTLPVPIIMAQQGWDDHNRGNRSTARALAYNYLNPLAKNAILLTNGDNDTFPLWFMQEVEGVRTDVRVLNQSLASSDWYMDQMRMKAYDSEPLPITIPKDISRQGGPLDYPVIFRSEPNAQIGKKAAANKDAKDQLNQAGDQLYTILQNTRFAVSKKKLHESLQSFGDKYGLDEFMKISNALRNPANMEAYGLDSIRAQQVMSVLTTVDKQFDFMTAADIISFISDRRNITDHPEAGPIFIVPCRGVVLHVDKKAVIENEVVPAELEDRIVSEMKWTLPRNMYRSQIITLDIMAHDPSWSRQLYVTGSGQIDPLFGLDGAGYVMNEGVVQKIVPVKFDRNDPAKYNRRKMYDNLMTDYEWGNMNGEGVLIDYHTRRDFFSFQQQFSALVELYSSDIRNGQDIDSASSAINNLVDRYFEVFPEGKMPYDFMALVPRGRAVIPFVRGLAMADNQERAISLAGNYADECLDYIKYASSFSLNASGVQDASLYRSIEENYDILMMLLSLSKDITGQPVNVVIKDEDFANSMLTRLAEAEKTAVPWLKDWQDEMKASREGSGAPISDQERRCAALINEMQTQIYLKAGAEAGALPNGQP